MAKDRRLDLRWVIQQMYHRMENRAKTKNLELLAQDVFMELALASDKLKQIHNEWVVAGFPIRLSPSTDRVNNQQGYSFGNIQFVTHSHNVAKGNHETGRKGHKPSNFKKVRLSKDSEELLFDSGSKASEFLGMNRAAVGQAIGRGVPLRGWKVEYEDNNIQKGD
jgi:hypothetical protein